MPQRRGVSMPAHQIEIRQRKEDEVKRYQDAVGHDGRLRMVGQWEQNSTRKMRHKELYHHMDVVQARHAEVLQQRRLRLAELLTDEQREHERMLRDLAETEDQRRDRLMQAARDLRNKREDKRKEECEKLRMLAFREQNQELHEAEVRKRTLLVAAQREEQLREKDELRRQKAEEDAIFSEMWEEERKAKIARAQRDMETKHVNVEKVKKNLCVQIDALEKRRQDEREQEARDAAKYKQEIMDGIAADQAADRARRQRSLDIAAETRKMNEKFKTLKEEEIYQLKAEEKKELDDLLAQIRQDEMDEQQRKHERKLESVEQMKYVEAQMNAQAESETALDRLWQEESDKQWDKREARWKEELERKQNLHRQVLEVRKQQVREQREKEALDDIGRENARLEMLREAEHLAELDRKAAADRRAKALDTQRYIEYQVKDKQEKIYLEKTGKTTELVALRKEEEAFREATQKELARIEKTKPSQFAHVKLTRDHTKFRQ